MSSQCLSVDDGDRLLLDLSKRVASVLGWRRGARGRLESLRGQVWGVIYGLTYFDKIFLTPSVQHLCHGTGWNINDHVAHYH